MKKELMYYPINKGATRLSMKPRISPEMIQAVKEVNIRDEREEKRRKVIATLGAVGLAVFVVTSFYFFAVALFTYGANW